MPFNLGPFEVIIILVIVFAIFGAGKLPQIGGALGKAVREFKSAQAEDEETPHRSKEEAEEDTPAKKA